jgi:hypothetical protein
LHTYPTNGLLSFVDFVPRGISQYNRCLLILGGHGSHVTIEAFEQVVEFELDMVTFAYSHFTHALALKCDLFQII